MAYTQTLLKADKTHFNALNGAELSSILADHTKDYQIK